MGIAHGRQVEAVEAVQARLAGMAGCRPELSPERGGGIADDMAVLSSS